MILKKYGFSLPKLVMVRKMRAVTFTFIHVCACIFLLPAYAQEAGQRLMQLVPEPIPIPQTTFSDGTQDIDLESYEGRYILINFWATWCVPCLKEMPSLDRLAVSLLNNKVAVIAISQDEAGPMQVRPYVEKLNLTQIDILYDPERKAFRDYGLRGIPTTFLISPQGTIIARLEGDAAWDEGALASQVKKITSGK